MGEPRTNGMEKRARNVVDLNRTGWDRVSKSSGLFKKSLNASLHFPSQPNLTPSDQRLVPSQMNSSYPRAGPQSSIQTRTLLRLLYAPFPPYTRYFPRQSWVRARLTSSWSISSQYAAMSPFNCLISSFSSRILFSSCAWRRCEAHLLGMIFSRLMMRRWQFGGGGRR